MGKEEKIQSLKLEHEHYLSELKIVLPTSISLLVGLVIALITKQINPAPLDGTTSIVAVVGYGLVFIYAILTFYRRKLKIIRTKLETVK